MTMTSAVYIPSTEEGSPPPGEFLVGEVTKAFSVFDEQLRSVPNDAPISAAPKEAAITTPTDSGYVPRVLDGSLGAGFAGETDVSFVTKAMKADMPVLLYGPPGTGKTSLVLAAFPNAEVLPGTSETETSDFVGAWVQRTDGTYEWVDGPLVRAMEAGVPLLVDEIALIDPRALAVLYSVMDGRGELMVTMNPARGTVTAAEGFVVAGACNPDAPGAIMSDALLSRFQLHIYVGTDWKLTPKLGIPKKIVSVARTLAKLRESDSILAAPQLRELLTFRDTHMVFGEEVALRNFVAQAREVDRQAYAQTIEKIYGTTVHALTF